MVWARPEWRGSSDAQPRGPGQAGRAAKRRWCVYCLIPVRKALFRLLVVEAPPPTSGGLMIDEVVAALLKPARPLAEAVASPAAGGMPAAPGVYAWWTPPGSLPDVVGPPHATSRMLELVYVGIAPGAPGAQRTMRDRLLKDHARRTRRSTLRRGLAAFLWEREAWTPITTGDSRPTLDRPSEALLTAWMRENLAVTWAVHDRPWDVEAAVIAQLSPPLNIEQNGDHPLYSLVRYRRDRWTSTARGASRP
jgi:hypothetical protein